MGWKAQGKSSQPSSELEKKLKSSEGKQAEKGSILVSPEKQDKQDKHEKQDKPVSPVKPKLPSPVKVKSSVKSFVPSPSKMSGKKIVVGGKGSPKKMKIVEEGSGVGPQQIVVPPAENGGLLYSGNTFSAVSVNKVESGRSRGLHRSVTAVDSYLADDSDYLLTEEEEEDDWLMGDGQREAGGRRARDYGDKDDIVHCICGSDVDEGFMIQVS